MPEGVEVCLTAQYLNLRLNGYKVTNYTVTGGKFARTGILGFADQKLPWKILSVNSKGKALWFQVETDNGIMNILSTFGLVGHWGFEKEEYSHVKLELTDGKNAIQLYYSDFRNFGNMALVDEEDLNDYINPLAPDLLKESFTDDELFARITASINRSPKAGNAKIVKILLEQKTAAGSIGSGIGNYLVAEILYHAKISPHTELKDIGSNRVLSDTLANSIRWITKLSYLTNRSGYMEHFTHFFDERQKLLEDGLLPIYHPTVKIPKGVVFEYAVYQKKIDPDGNKVFKDKIVSGRSTYWVKTVQH